MLMWELNVDVDQLVQRVKITKEEPEILERKRKERLEHFQKKKTKDYMDCLKGEDNYGRMV